MSYDANKPANNAPVSSSELRNQFTGLMDEIQLRPLSSDVADAIEQTAAGVNTVALLGLSVSNPPTQAQVQAIANKLDELITGLKRA